MTAPQIDAGKYPCKDAKKPIAVRVMPIDGDEGNPRDPGGCAISLAGIRQYHFLECIIYRTVIYTLEKGDTVYTRYETSRGCRDVLENFDINKAHAVKRIPPEGVVVIFRVPCDSNKLGTLRSKDRLARHAASLRRRRRRKKKPITKRSYRAPDPLTFAGVRWGSVKR